MRKVSLGQESRVVHSQSQSLLDYASKHMDHS